MQTAYNEKRQTVDRRKKNKIRPPDLLTADYHGLVKVIDRPNSCWLRAGRLRIV